jgi:YVTN family beta-propeller protein
VNPATDMVYLTDPIGGKLALANGATHTLIRTFLIQSKPKAVAVNPTTNTIYVTCYSLLDQSLVVVDGATNSFGPPITGLGHRATGLVVNPVTNTIYVAEEQGSGTVADVDGATNAVIGAISVGGEPAGLAVNPTTNRLYVTTAAGVVTVIAG